MLESGLFFALGFLCATLLTLMVAPAIWRRAVVLTQKRIENSVPLTLNEIQADKDQMRAEFAMNMRRLEVEMEKLTEHSNQQTLEIDQRRDAMVALKTERDENTVRIAGLTTQMTELKDIVAQRERVLADTSNTLSATEMKLEERTRSLQDLDNRYRTTIDDFDGQKIEIVARETRLDTIQEEARRSRQLVKDKTAEQDRLASELKAATSTVIKERDRNETLDKKLTKLQADMADVEGRLERRDLDIARLREKLGGNGGGHDAAEKERGELMLKLKSSEADREALNIEISALRLGSEGTGDPLTENAMMRERISDLAAKVTAMTATAEGPDSPIYKALAKDEKSSAGPASGKSRAKKPGSSQNAKSLADRVRAIQSASEKA